MGALLELQDVHAAYGLSRVLFGISLEVNPGECVCLLGRNGVGKTTTMRTVMGLTPPSTGRVRFKPGLSSIVDNTEYVGPAMLSGD